jgi:hypothetical protein
MPSRSLPQAASEEQENPRPHWRANMRVLATAAIITSLAVPAFAQGDPAKAEANKAAEQKKKESEEIERAYKDMLKRTTREQPIKRTDPWGNLR